MAKICFFLCLIGALCTFSCQLSPKSQVKTFSCSLPSWPPEQEFCLYPELAYWIIETPSSSFRTTDQKVLIEHTKSSPFYLLAYPVTKTQEGNLTQFFKPAGLVYPYEQDKLTWENGYAAEVMKTLWKGSQDCEKDKAEFLLKFNWKRFMEIVQSKIEESFEWEDERGCYNPWTIPVGKIAELIASKKFYATVLNIPVTSYSTLHLNNEMEKYIVSSFVPENKVLQKKYQVCLSSQNINLFSIYNTFGVIIYGVKGEKNSLKLINLPIIKE